MSDCALTLITGNASKAAEFERLLGRAIGHRRVALIEPQALDVRVVCASKAAQAYAEIGRPVLVDDTALAIRAWNGLPGALISWFLDSVGCVGLLRMAIDLEDRAATVTTALGYADQDGVRVFTGEVSGHVPLVPRGAGGFGYDSIFVPKGFDTTFAEMTATEKDAISMRKRAVDSMRQELAF